MIGCLDSRILLWFVMLTDWQDGLGLTFIFCPVKPRHNHMVSAQVPTRVSVIFAAGKWKMLGLVYWFIWW